MRQQRISFVWHAKRRRDAWDVDAEFREIFLSRKVATAWDVIYKREPRSGHTRRQKLLLIIVEMPHKRR